MRVIGEAYKVSSYNQSCWNAISNWKTFEVNCLDSFSIAKFSSKKLKIKIIIRERLLSWMLISFTNLLGILILVVGANIDPFFKRVTHLLFHSHISRKSPAQWRYEILILPGSSFGTLQSVRKYHIISKWKIFWQEIMTHYDITWLKVTRAASFSHHGLKISSRPESSIWFLSTEFILNKPDPTSLIYLMRLFIFS